MKQNRENLQPETKISESHQLKKVSGDQIDKIDDNTQSIQMTSEKFELPAESANDAGIDPSLEKILQKNFIRKVLSILFIMWLISIIIVSVIVINEDVQEFVQDNSWLFYICIVGLIIQGIALYCYRQTAKKVPYNYLLLFGFTFCISYTLGYMSARISETALIASVGLTTIVVLFLSIYAWKTDKDITYKVCMMGYTPMAIILLILCLLTFRDQITEVIISLLIVGIFGAFLVFDIQRLKGKFFVSYKIDDYIIAALDIYIDVVLLFKYLTDAISN